MADINGVVINEFLPTPTAGGPAADTDQDGNNELPGDQFVELFNTSLVPVDLGGWTITTAFSGPGSPFTFDPGFILQPGQHVVVVNEIDPTSPVDTTFFLEGLPQFFDFGFSAEIVLSDGTDSIAAIYDGGSSALPPADVDNFGPETEGLSLDRVPDGSSTNFEAVEPNPECFLTGTLILTENGYKAVEELKIGDLVQTADGKLEAVKWIGYQTFNPEQIGNPLRGNPIQIKAGALGNNLPLRDLYVSPDHSMFIDGLLINAGALVNDISIVQTEPTETFTYCHVELEKHCLLVAEGAAAESYLSQKEDREGYDNGAEYEELYPHGNNLVLWPMDYPRVSSWNKVPRFVSKKLLKIAHQLFDQNIQLRA